VIPFGELTNPKGAMIITRDSYTQLSKAERSSLYMMLKSGMGVREIGRKLGRSHSTISRELKRNSFKVEEANKLASASERTDYAEKLSKERKCARRKRCKLEVNEDLRFHMIAELKEGRSPRDIAFGIGDFFPGQKLCASTMYNFFNSPKHRMSYLKEYLRHRGKKFKVHVTAKKSRIKKRGNPKKRSIHDMASYEVAPFFFGHLQIDCIVSCKNGSGAAILTIVDIFTQYVWHFKVADLRSETINATLRGFMSMFPLGMIKTILSDNGSEFEHLYELERVYPGLKIYYCDPYSPGQRGLCEYKNREFRWYYSKGTDFGNVTSQEIWTTSDKLNDRRRPCLGGKTSKQMLEKALASGPSLIQLVDLKKSFEWNPCNVDFDYLNSQKKQQQQHYDHHLYPQQKTGAGLRWQQSSGLFLPSQDLSGCSSFYNKNIGINFH
jgi:transposase, IS30 family